MADQANVYVKNSLSASIEVIREQPDRSQEVYVLSTGKQEMIFLASSDVNLFIKAPKGMDMGVPFGLKSSIGIFFSCSIANGRWKIRTEPSNSEITDTPTTVNIDIGEDE